MVKAAEGTKIIAPENGGGQVELGYRACACVVCCDAGYVTTVLSWKRMSRESRSKNEKASSVVLRS